jgi:hypothetical protein
LFEQTSLSEFQHDGGAKVGRSTPAARDGQRDKPVVLRFEFGQLP